MSYCTLSDLSAEFSDGEIAQLANRGYGEDSDVIDQAIAFADDMIDGYLRERYPLPLASIPKNLVGVAADIARYRLYQAQPTDLVVQRYEMAVAWLKDVARGLVTLDLDKPFEGRLAHSTPPQIFTRLVW